MKKILITMVATCFSVLFINCAGSWHCYVDAIGEHPSNKTYYTESRFPEELNPLVIKEYINHLDVVMSHLGYTKVDSTDATVKLAFGYVLGDITQEVSSTPIFQYNPPKETTTKSTITTATGKEVAKVNTTTSSEKDKYGTTTYVGSNTQTKDKQPITLILDAFDVKTKEPVWSVRANDETSPDNINNLRRYMPLYLLDMYPYIGSNTRSQKWSSVSTKDKRLQWFTTSEK